MWKAFHQLTIVTPHTHLTGMQRILMLMTDDGHDSKKVTRRIWDISLVDLSFETLLGGTASYCVIAYTRERSGGCT